MDTTKYKVESNIVPTDFKLKEHIVVEVIKPKENPEAFYETPLFSSLIFPLVITLLTFFITKYFIRKKERVELDKLATDIKRNNAEIKMVESSFQPIVLTSLQAIQNELFMDKINSLRALLKSKYVFFKLEREYHKGEPVINDTDQYYQNIYQNFSDDELAKFNENSMMNSSLFSTSIRQGFNELTAQLNDIKNIRKNEYSLQNMNMPQGGDKKLEEINECFSRLIDLIRLDLHLDNTFIHDFISRYQKIDKNEKSL